LFAFDSVLALSLSGTPICLHALCKLQRVLRRRPQLALCRNYTTNLESWANLSMTLKVCSEHALVNIRTWTSSPASRPFNPATSLGREHVISIEDIAVRGRVHWWSRFSQAQSPRSAAKNLRPCEGSRTSKLAREEESIGQVPLQSYCDPTVCCFSERTISTIVCAKS
jgi:hypothetical protein